MVKQRLWCTNIEYISQYGLLHNYLRFFRCILDEICNEQTRRYDGGMGDGWMDACFLAMEWGECVLCCVVECILHRTNRSLMKSKQI